MKYAYVLSGLVAMVSAHGVITEVQGANGVKMAGLSVVDGTPRDCANPLCGSEEDTAIIREREMGSGRASALGRNQQGPVDADKAIRVFMGSQKSKIRRQLEQLVGMLTGAPAANAGGAGTAAPPPPPAAGAKTAEGTKEGGVSRAAGTGAQSGLPTTSDSGEISMTFHQINQDGAGPLTAQIDATSGGKDQAAFKEAQVTTNVPGIGVGGLSGAAVMDFPVKVQMPAGMKCTGSAGGANNVCIVRLQNAALAGPFGGSAAFTQSPAARKRAVEYNLRKRHMTRGVLKQ